MSERTILCVDDEANILQSLKRLLRREDYTILTASSGSEGLALLESNPMVELVISDQRMPGMTGTEFLQQVKEKFPDITRVILSGYADAATILESINKGEIYRFLTKPWNDDEIKIIVRQCFEHYDLLKQNQQLVEQISVQNWQLRSLNHELETSYQQQSDTLQFSQEVLEKMPIPILGISREGRIILLNERLKETFPTFKTVSPGMDIYQGLPSELLSLAKVCVETGNPQKAASLVLNGQQVRLSMQAIGHENCCSGYLLILEVLSYARC